MEPIEIDDVEDSIKGAVIESVENGLNGLHITLQDGRILLFPECELVAVFRPTRTLQ